MADPRGFLKSGREVAERRPVEERVQDWQEVYPGGPGRALLPIISTQASRCMDCGIPFCHQGCPLGNLIPEWNDLVWRNDWDGAMDRLHATNNFPEFTGRLCPAPCETACVLGINQDPVTIKNVEVAIIDRAWSSGYVRPRPPEWLSGRTVAVIGSVEQGSFRFVESAIGDDAGGRVSRMRAMTADMEALVAASQDSNADDEHDPEGPTIAYERSQLASLLDVHVAVAVPMPSPTSPESTTCAVFDWLGTPVPQLFAE